MLAKSVQEAVAALEDGRGPVEVTRSLAAQLATEHPGLLDGRVKAMRLAAFGPAPYTAAQFGAFELRILPDGDVPSRDESKARAKFDRALAEAREREEVAHAAYEVADKTYLDLFGHQIAIGESWGLSSSGQLVQHARSRVITNDERNALKAKLADAEEARREAGDALYRARIKLHKLERQADDAARLVRLTRS